MAPRAHTLDGHGTIVVVGLDIHRPPWMEQAACRGRPVATFVPTPSSGGGPPSCHAVAALVCARCPVADECLRYGLATGSIGTWGGRWLGRYHRPRVDERVQVAS